METVPAHSTAYLFQQLLGGRQSLSVTSDREGRPSVISQYVCLVWELKSLEFFLRGLDCDLHKSKIGLCCSQLGAASNHSHPRSNSGLCSCVQSWEGCGFCSIAKIPDQTLQAELVLQWTAQTAVNSSSASMASTACHSLHFQWVGLQDVGQVMSWHEAASMK